MKRFPDRFGYISSSNLVNEMFQPQRGPYQSEKNTFKHVEEVSAVTE